MNATAASSPVAGRRVIAAAALLAIYMQAVNISLPNASLQDLQGTLSMADDEVGWIFDAYIAAGAVVLPITRWLAGRFGRKMVLQLSIVLFAIGLVLDTLATTPDGFALARIFQGAAGGTLVPLSLAILLDSRPPASHPRVSMAVATIALFGISSGPGIGGWLSEYHGWHSMFYSCLPIAGFIFLAMGFWLPEKRAQPNPRFDFLGWASFSLGLTGVQMLLDRGERLEWFDSREIWAEAIAAALGFYVFIVHVLTTDRHFLDKALFRDRNFVLSTIMFFALGVALLPTLALTSPMLDELLAYPVDTTGYMTIPRGAALVSALVLMGFIPPRADFRPFAAGGMALVVYGSWRMLGYSPAMDWQAVAMAGLLQGAGLGIALPAVTKTAFTTLDSHLHPEGTALFNVVRLYGSTLGIAVVLVFFYGNTQAMHLALAKDLRPYRAAAHVAGIVSKHGLAALNEAVTGQAAFVGIVGQFKILMFAVLVASPLVLGLRNPRPAN